jgi:hypothetical protein
MNAQTEWVLMYLIADSNKKKEYKGTTCGFTDIFIRSNFSVCCIWKMNMPNSFRYRASNPYRA